MKHDWDYSDYGSRTSDLSVLGRRVCRNCGAEQERHPIFSWMRVIGYRWEPLVGRCKPNKETNEGEVR